MNHRKDYSLYKRGDVWYYRCYDPYGRRTVARSTGETNKALAERFCNSKLRDGSLVPARVRLFSDFATEWWEWDRCLYIAGSLEIIAALLKDGADINAARKYGQTVPVAAAMLNQNPEVITALLKAGADGKAKDNYGKTAFDFAQVNDKLKGTAAYWALNDAQY